jgi:chaperonin cofactor prefoldin
MTILLEVSPGELIDKMTILEIKLAHLANPDQLANVRREYDLVKQTFSECVENTPALADLIGELKVANLALWEIEDAIRDHERNQDFGETFVQLARSVYRTNDRRSAIKRRINRLLDSTLIEEKSYHAY